MNDPLAVLVRVFSILYVPLMLALPLGIVLLMPQRLTQAPQLALARSQLIKLIVATALALAVWLGVLLASVPMPDGPLRVTANFAWVLFFPLWFGLAMPTVRARNPVWGGALAGERGSGDSVRTASLVPRAKEHPIRRRHWAFVALVLLGLLAAVAARGLRPFGEDGLDQAQRTRWLASLMVFVPILLVTFAVVPRSLRRAHQEPEPLDEGGSAELVEMYRSRRLGMVRGMFWLLGFALPVFLGGMMAVGVWWPTFASELGLVGGLGGAAIGVAGAAFGCWMSFQRVRIAEAKTRLDASRGLRAR